MLYYTLQDLLYKTIPLYIYPPTQAVMPELRWGPYGPQNKGDKHTRSQKTQLQLEGWEGVGGITPLLGLSGNIMALRAPLREYGLHDVKVMCDDRCLAVAVLQHVIRQQIIPLGCLPSAIESSRLKLYCPGRMPRRLSEGVSDRHVPTKDQNAGPSTKGG